MILAQMILAQMTLTQIEPVLAFQDAQHTDPNFGYHPPQSPQTAAGNVRPKAAESLALRRYPAEIRFRLGGATVFDRYRILAAK